MLSSGLDMAMEIMISQQLQDQVSHNIGKEGTDTLQVPSLTEELLAKKGQVVPGSGGAHL